jgi:hypothetical protein
MLTTSFCIATFPLVFLFSHSVVSFSLLSAGGLPVSPGLNQKKVHPLTNDICREGGVPALLEVLPHHLRTSRICIWLVFPSQLGSAHFHK